MRARYRGLALAYSDNSGIPRFDDSHFNSINFSDLDPIRNLNHRAFSRARTVFPGQASQRTNHDSAKIAAASNGFVNLR